MNDVSQTGTGNSRRSFAVLVTVLLLIVATVGGSLSFFYQHFFVSEYPVHIRGTIERFVQVGTPSVQMELKAASTVAAEGFSQKMISPSGETLFISDKSGLTSADVKAAGVRKVDDNFVIEVEFNDAGAKALKKLSTELLVEDRDTATERLAILLDGKLKGAPVVWSVIDGGAAQIHLNELLTSAEATKLAKGIVGTR